MQNLSKPMVCSSIWINWLGKILCDSSKRILKNAKKLDHPHFFFFCPLRWFLAYTRRRSMKHFAVWIASLVVVGREWIHSSERSRSTSSAEKKREQEHWLGCTHCGDLDHKAISGAAHRKKERDAALQQVALLLSRTFPANNLNGK